MAIDGVLTTLDGIPEPLQEHYVKTEEGTYQLQVNGFKSEKEIVGLKNTLNEIKTERDSLKKAYNPFKEAGLTDINAVLDGLTERDKLKALDPAKEADRIIAERIDSVNREWTRKHGEEISVKEQQINQLNSQLRNINLENIIRDAAIKTDAFAVAAPYIKQYLGFKEDGTVFVKGANGTIQYNNAGKEMTVVEKMHELRENPETMMLFRGTGNAGGNSTPGFAAPMKTADGKIRIQKNDQKSMNKHLDDIANGNVEFYD